MRCLAGEAAAARGLVEAGIRPERKRERADDEQEGDDDELHAPMVLCRDY
jgi:hypothetical protein